MADIKFIKSYDQGYPEKFDEVLDPISKAVVCSLNRPGSLLAVGCNDGRIIVWDVNTRIIIKSTIVHVHPITSISWSRYSDYILLGSSDYSVTYIHLKYLEVKKRFHFTYPVTSVEFHPREKYIISKVRPFTLICVMRELPVMLNLKNEQRNSLLLPDTSHHDRCFIAKFDKRGDHIYIENGRGTLFVFKCDTLDIIKTFSICTHASQVVFALSMEFSRKIRDDLLINCHDRTIRLYRCEDILNSSKTNIEPFQVFKDLIANSVWRKCCFSHDSEYVVAGTSRQHNIFIFERETGGLVKMLDGKKGEILSDLTCHPVRPIYFSVSNGLISIWSNPSSESWSAYAPGFIELEENYLYVEKENEFDVEDEDRRKYETKSIEIKEEYLENIDVITTDRPIYCSSDEDGNEQHSMICCVPGDDSLTDRFE